jgi:hypothetical protein
MVFIFSYNRKEMLENVFQHTGHLDPIIIDDGSDFKIEYRLFVQYQHGGKEHFSEKYDYALKMAEKSSDDFYMFLQDDFLDLDINGILSIYNELKDNAFICNIINDGRIKCWNRICQKQVNDHLYKVGFVDGSYFFNRSAGDKIGWHMNPIDPARFLNPRISAGEGEQLTARLVKNNVPNQLNR